MRSRLGLLLSVCVLFCGLVFAVDLPASDPIVWRDGRVLQNADQSVSLDWSLTQLSFCATTAVLSVTLSDTGGSLGSQFDVILDGAVVGLLNLSTSTTATVHTLWKSQSGTGEFHQFAIRKRTEALTGVTTIHSFSADLFQACSHPLSSRSIELIGDSITCAYGNLGKTGCHFSPNTEDAVYSYENIAAQSMGADLHITCWSGKGMVRNYAAPNTTSPDPFPTYYGRIVANYPESPENAWNFSSWVPSAVVINLGTNDYSVAPQPPQNVFENGYHNLVQRIRSNYGKDTWIFMLCGPMIQNPCCEYVQSVASSYGLFQRVAYVDMHVLTESSDYGCDGHPSVQGHSKMAVPLENAFEKYLGWRPRTHE
eukprot:ANDGO_00417.mRNA.1 Cellulase/esterase CelE